MTSWGWPLILLATIVNQLPLVSFLVPTEPVYVYLGSRLLSDEATGLTDGPWFLLLVCILGAWVGNQGAFWLGRSVGGPVIARMKVAEGATARARARFDRHGAGFVIVAQLVWPIATWMQVMAGSWGMAPRTYLLASLAGAVLAIGQYALFGYTSAYALDALGLTSDESLLAVIGPYWVLLGFVALLCLGAAIIVTRGRGHPVLRVAYVVLLALLMLIAVNLGTLDNRRGLQVRIAPLPLATACSLLDATLVARSGPTTLHVARPINLVLTGIDDPATLLASEEWLRVRTYVGGPMDALEALRLTWVGTPPAATVLLDGMPTDLAWQERPGAVPRVQLWLWPVIVPGDEPVFLGSVVEIDEVTFRLNGPVPSLAYDLRLRTDDTRDRVAATLAASASGTITLIGPGEPLEVADEFITDGNAAEVRAAGSEGLTAMCGSEQD